MNITRHCFILIASAVISSLAAASTPHENAIAEYVAAGNSLITVLTGIKDVNTAKAAQTNLQGAMVRFNAAKDALNKLNFDKSDPAHLAAVKNATTDLQGIGVRLSAEMARIRKLPQVRRTLQQTLAMGSSTP